MYPYYPFPSPQYGQSYMNYPSHPYPMNPYIYQPPYVNNYYDFNTDNYFNYERGVSSDFFFMDRQQTVRGQASWTEGGNVTRCNIPWSANNYMTVAVGENAPYQCGQTLKVINTSTPEGKEINVIVVDVVPGYPQNKLNLHRRAFEALGANPDLGVINVEFFPATAVEEGQWGNYLLGITQSAYPGVQITDYKFVEKRELTPDQTKETYEFKLQRQQGQSTVQSNVIYNPKTGQVISFDVKDI